MTSYGADLTNVFIYIVEFCLLISSTHAWVIELWIVGKLEILEA